MQQVYYANHHYAVDNISFGTKRDPVKLVLSSSNRRVKVHSFVRDRNNAYKDGVTQHRDRVVFRSGNQRGTGILVTRPVDDRKSQSYSIWLPSLRKIRRHAEPAQNDAWGGSPFTYGDIYLRKPKHETHELIGEERFPKCLRTLRLMGNKDAVRRYSSLIWNHQTSLLLPCLASFQHQQWSLVCVNGP